MRELRFAGRVLLCLLGFITLLWLLGRSFAYSHRAGYVFLAVIAGALCATAPRWVKWLPGLLIFGVLNSLFALTTGHAPTDHNVVVSRVVSGLLLVFYIVGWKIADHYNATPLSAFDRLAWLTYLICMIWPAFFKPDLSTLTPVVAWPMGIGMGLVLTAFATHRWRLGERRLAARKV